jgi:hypothetical protein
VVEDLNLQGCKGQKRFAYKALHHSLIGKAPIEVVNSAYTSQTCPSCGYVSRGNRNGIKFQCGSCGRISHADVVGAMNLLGRSEDKQVPLKLHYRQAGTILKERFRRRRTSSSRRKRSRTVRPGAYCSSTSSTAPNAVMDESP